MRFRVIQRWQLRLTELSITYEMRWHGIRCHGGTFEK